MTTFRVLRTARATLTRTFYLDEVATGASGSVGVRVARWDDTEIQSGTAAADGNGGYTFTFIGSDTLDELTVTWTATVGGDAIVLDQDVIEVVGGFYVGLSEIRGIDPKFRGVNGTTQFPTADLIARRIEVENEFELICGQAFVPRYARDVLSGPPYRPVGYGRYGCGEPLALRWPLLRRVRAVTVAGVALSQTDVDSFGPDTLGLLRRNSGWPYGTGNIVVEYEHGGDRVPTDIARVAKLRLKSLLLTQQSPLPDRAERIATTEVGTVLLAVAGKDKTGIPEVDAVLERHPSPRPGFG